MGQKVHPIGMRLGISTDWNSVWYASNQGYADQVHNDWQVRDFLRKKLANASVSLIRIERPARSAKITICTARPGSINISEIRKPELDAYLVAEGVAQQLERRIMFRRAMKRAVSSTMRLGALGVRIAVAGRLNGAEIARTEWYREGRVPLHTLRADIDYGLAEANTTYGVIGVKVWIFKGEVFDLENKSNKNLSSKADRANKNKEA